MRGFVLWRSEKHIGKVMPDGQVSGSGKDGEPAAKRFQFTNIELDAITNFSSTCVPVPPHVTNSHVAFFVRTAALFVKLQEEIQNQ